jgi:hypothetical protein
MNLYMVEAWTGRIKTNLTLVILSEEGEKDGVMKILKGQVYFANSGFYTLEYRCQNINISSFWR